MTRAALSTTIDPTAAMIVGAGQIARCDDTGDEATAALLDTINGTVATFGDNAYPDGSDTAYTNCYDPSWGRQKARTRPAPGDVEYSTSGAPGYFHYFGGAAGDPTKGYYSYNLGTWHVVVLNSTKAKDSTSAQYKWLQADLAANTASCTLAYWHHPLFYSGNTSNYHASMKPLWDVLYKYGAEVILNGHIRNYERFAPQTPDGVADSVYGLREFVVGTGGYDLGSAFGTPWPTSQVRYRGSFGVLALTLNDGSYHWQFVPEAGATFSDTGTTACHGAPPSTDQPPVANPGGPYTGVTGVAVPFDGTASSDPDGDALNYAWDFGDGTTGSGPTPTHTYAQAATYTLSLVVTDPSGLADTAATTATISASSILFSYHIGDSEYGFTSTGRSTYAWYHDINGVLRRAGSGVIRDSAYVRSNDGVLRKTVLLEGQSTNRYTWSEPTKAQAGAGCTAGVTDGTAGAFAAYGFANGQGLHFAAAAQADRCYPPVTISSGTQYSISAYVIMDDGSAPVVGGNTTTGDFSLVVDNTIVAANLRVYNVAGPLYRVSGTYTSVGSSANDGISRAATQSGRGFTVVGFDIENQANATSYIQTLGATYTRNLDQFHAPISFDPQPLTLYARFVEQGAAYESGTFIQIGSRTSTENPRMILSGNASRPYRVRYSDPSGIGGTAGFSSPMPKVGDIVELRGVVKLVNGSPVVYIGQSINGGPETVSSTASGATSLGTAWTQYLLDWTSGSAREKSIIETGVIAGEASLATCRALLP